MYAPLDRWYPPPRKHSWAEDHPGTTVVLVLVAAGAVIAWWQAFVILGVAAIVGACLWAFQSSWDARYLERVRARQALIARAEWEHHRLMAGDPRGVFGQYPPAV